MEIYQSQPIDVTFEPIEVNLFPETSTKMIDSSNKHNRWLSRVRKAQYYKDCTLFEPYYSHILRLNPECLIQGPMC